MMDAFALETAIADLRSAAFVCLEAAEHKLTHGGSLPRREGFHQIMLNDDELNGLLFLIGEVETRARTLDKAFHNALDASA